LYFFKEACLKKPALVIPSSKSSIISGDKILYPENRVIYTQNKISQLFL